jgi:hypothetical protein
MRQYSLFTHGTALATENPENLAHQVKVGWGTQIVFREPVPENVSGLGTVFAKIGPGSWFHIPLISTLNTFGKSNPQLDSVTILFETSHCRISNVHVWDGATIVEEFNNLGPFGLKGAFLHTRNPQDVQPETPLLNPQPFPNTRKLRKPHKVFSAIGISFFACAHFEDFNHQGRAHNPQFDGPFPPSILTIAAGGGQFLVDDSLSVTLSIDKIHILVGP